MRRLPWSTPLLSALCFGMVGIGTGLRFAAPPRPGPTAAVPVAIPDDLAQQLDWSGDRPLVVVAAAARCPLLPATIATLADELADERPATVRVLVFLSGAPATDLDAAAFTALRDRLPRGIVRADRGGLLARRLGAATSGHVDVFAPGGTTVFAGGLVDARGVPDASAVATLRQALGTTHKAGRPLPVYGLPLAAACGGPR